MEFGNEKNETIVAVSTPPGEGGIGIVRLSGPQAKNIAMQIFVRTAPGTKPKKQTFKPEAKKLYYGYVIDEQGREIDEVLFCFMPAPFTYTREDIVEINAHGGIVPLGNILQLLMRKGARLAEPGEFTKRAYLNGRIDLLQAESVLAIIRAKTEKGLKAAMQSLKGAVSGEIMNIRAEIINILAEIEADIEFSHEDLDILSGEQSQNVINKVRKLKERMCDFLEKRKRGRILQEGLRTVIIGKPNVGKSSLYNYLVREERAIVTEIPGTTRDLLVEYINIKGIPLKLVDTAGLHKSNDKVEKIGMEISRKAMAEADLLLFLLDATTGITVEDTWIHEKIPLEQKQGIIVVINKIDLKKDINKEKVNRQLSCNNVVETSLVTGEGLEELEAAITRMVFSGDLQGNDGGALFMEARQGELLSRAACSLADALAALEQGYPLDIVSIDLQQVKLCLAALLGEDINEAVLDNIFKKFCVGK